ncbi:hypothetical protein [Chondrinema litorale]|uniref:hypothetical protein n=1 Tax=Chondrinema litorale TaxID=2994555 RepID=UPI002542C1A4|nr:hypothetical protein [Chondrinema litorale]UZR98495.1 hypothetical protein OQ292_31295 [Chondrinema litorale]
MEEITWLNYYKTVLEKVSFDAFLLKKEYEKAKKMLLPHQHIHLDSWMQQKGYLTKLASKRSTNPLHQTEVFRIQN